MTATTHPLFGRLLSAVGFKRLNGVLHLVVMLPDDSPGTIPAASTDVLPETSVLNLTTVLSVDGIRALHRLTVALCADRHRAVRRRK